MATSPTLAATHYVVLRTVRLNPPALPTPPGAPANVSVISPTSQIGVTVVLANQGSSNEPHVTVRFSLTDQTSGATTSQDRTTSLALAASVTLPGVTLRVKPSTSYLLTVQVIPLPARRSRPARRPRCRCRSHPAPERASSATSRGDPRCRPHPFVVLGS